MNFDLIDLPLLFGGIFGLGLVVRLLVGPNQSRMATSVYVAVLMISVWQFFVFALNFSGNIVKLPHLAMTGFPMELLVGPLMYLYSASTFLGRPKFRWYDICHLLPYLSLVFFLKGFYLKDSAWKIKVLSVEPQLGPLPLSWLLIFLFILLSKAAYFTLFLRNLRKFERLVANRTADNSIVENLGHYRKCTWIFLGYAILFSCLVVALSIWKVYGLYVDYAWYILKSIFLYSFAFIAIACRDKSIDSVPLNAIRLVSDRLEREPEEANTQCEAEAIDPPPSARKYAKSGLPSSRADQLHSKLVDFIEAEKPHLESELSLVSLAERLDVHPNHLSQVINQKANQSFSDFINEYRISHAKQLLSDPSTQNLNIIEIALESGFNNRPSFNRVFKKATSQTPSQYRKNS